MISILVVEDHQTVAQMIGRFLEKYMDSAKTSIVSSAEAALEMFDGMRPAGEHEAPDIVLVDVSLPKMSGIELVAILHKSFPDMPCLMLSGHKEATYARRSLEAGARGYVTKGNPPALIEGVKRVLDGGVYVSEDLNLE